MAKLELHSLPDLVAINTVIKHQCGDSVEVRESVVPGQPVRHKDDPWSYGVCLSRRWIWDDRPMQCEVLWSRSPCIYVVSKHIRTVLSQSIIAIDRIQTTMDKVCHENKPAQH